MSVFIESNCLLKGSMRVRFGKYRQIPILPEFQRGASAFIESIYCLKGLCPRVSEKTSSNFPTCPTENQSRAGFSVYPAGRRESTDNSLTTQPMKRHSFSPMVQPLHPRALPSNPHFIPRIRQGFRVQTANLPIINTHRIHRRDCRRKEQFSWTKCGRAAFRRA